MAAPIPFEECPSLAFDPAKSESVVFPADSKECRTLAAVDDAFGAIFAVLDSWAEIAARELEEKGLRYEPRYPEKPSRKIEMNPVRADDVFNAFFSPTDNRITLHGGVLARSLDNREVAYWVLAHEAAHGVQWKLGVPWHGPQLEAQADIWARGILRLAGLELRSGPMAIAQFCGVDDVQDLSSEAITHPPTRVRYVNELLRGTEDNAIRLGRAARETGKLTSDMPFEGAAFDGAREGARFVLDGPDLSGRPQLKPPPPPADEIESNAVSQWELEADGSLSARRIRTVFVPPVRPSRPGDSADRRRSHLEDFAVRSMMQLGHATRWRDPRVTRALLESAGEPVTDVRSALRAAVRRLRLPLDVLQNGILDIPSRQAAPPGDPLEAALSLLGVPPPAESPSAPLGPVR